MERGTENPLRLPRPGEVLDLAEEDYRYGFGRIRLRVSTVLGVTGHPHARWVDLTGVEFRWNGDRGRERPIQVRLAALGRRHA